MEQNASATSWAAQDTAPIPFRFSGSGNEYFKIWIVNLCLTILTLGIYSAWAKVRRNRYFYGNTSAAGNSFDYLANPVAILKGRLIAVSFFIALKVSEHESLTVYGILMVVFLFLFPWVIVRAHTFRARNTSWRNIRFNFEGTYSQAFVNYILLPAFPMALIIVPSFHAQPHSAAGVSSLLMPMALGLLILAAIAPYLYYRQRKWVVEQSGFGFDRFHLEATIKDFYKVFGMLLLIMIGIGVLFGILGVAVATGAAGLAPKVPGHRPELGATFYAFLIGIYVVLIFAYGFMFAYFNARFSNLVFNGASIEGHGFQSTQSPWGLYKIYVGNLFGIILTLGLFIPWAKVRTAQYMATNLYLVPNGDLNRFIGEQSASVSAAGEEMGEMFDIGIGL